MEQFFELTIVIFLGLVLGSFATALCYRLPRGLSMIAKARSQCPACEHNLGIADLFPLFSWIFLKGKCRYCRTTIGVQYPLIELATLGVCLLFYFVYGLKPETAVIFILAPVLVSIVDIDLRYKIIPDSLNFAIFMAGVAALGVNAMVAARPADFIIEQGGFALGGALVYGLGSLLLRQVAQMIVKRESMGLGDVKFFAAAGFWLGLNPNAASALMMISGLLGIVLALIWKKRTGEAEVPFGPSLIIAFVVALQFFPPEFMKLGAM
jgi:leader peptidase (prepilin peptidase)/N-methyltransferase